MKFNILVFFIFTMLILSVRPNTTLKGTTLQEEIKQRAFDRNIRILNNQINFFENEKINN